MTTRPNSTPAFPRPRSFNQTERITARLRDLVRSYPKGLGLVKEFLQNADDAGASVLRIIYDRRRHPGQMSTHEQEVVLGPALLFANDRTFAEQDIINIQRIGGGGKLHEAQGTGRFGQGFNTCYSVTDHPSFLSGDWIVWFDPHQRAHGSEQNAWAWSLNEIAEHWPAWTATFSPAGFDRESSYHDGTIFRLPLRSLDDAHRSEILAEPFTDSDFEDILDAVRQAGPSLLVFLRSVQMLYIDEISSTGTFLERFHLETSNRDKVYEERAQLRTSVHGDPVALLSRWTQSEDPLPVARYQHKFRIVVDAEVKAETWMVVTGFFRGPDDRLLTQAQDVCAHNEKALPWAGAATPLNAAAPIGGLACFLPLPEPTEWPLLLHGWFDLDSARRGITRQAGAGDTTRIRATWNLELLRYGVGPACAELVEQFIRQAAVTADPYRLWLQPSVAKDDYDRALVEGFYANIGARPVFRCIGPEGEVWRSLAGMGKKYWVLGTNWHKQLRSPLLASANTLIEPPLPEFIVEALQNTSYPARTLSTDVVRRILRPLAIDEDINCALHDAPRKALQQPDWVTVLARFSAQDGFEKLSGLPLALLADGRLHTFGKCGALYLVDHAERKLLASLPHRMLDGRFQEQVGLTRPVAALNLKKLDLPGLVECVEEILLSGEPDEAWLVLLFEYLERFLPADVKRHKNELQTLTVIPDQEGRRWQMGNYRTPVLPENIPESLQIALNRLGVPIITGSEELISSIRRFASRHHRFIEKLTPNRLATALASHAANPWMRMDALADRQVIDVVLDFLSPPQWLDKDDSRLNALRRLPILPTTDSSLASAEEEDLYVAGGFHPPAGIGGRHRLLDTGNNEFRADLFKALKIRRLDAFTFVVSVLLPTFHKSTREIQLKMLSWLRDHLRDIQSSLSPEQAKNLRRRLRRAAILPVKNGGMELPCKTYRPDARDALDVLGDVAKIPDPEVFGDAPTQWKSFFIDLSLLSVPLPDDLLMSVRQCMADAETHGTERALQRLKRLRDHIVARWDSLTNPEKGDTQHFIKTLAAMAWLPAAKPSLEKVASAAEWPDRLFKASELAAPRLLHLVASVRPVLEGAELPTEMAAALGMHTHVPLDEVLRHFTAVRHLNLDEATASVRTACYTSFLAFLDYIARLSDDTKSNWEPRLALLRNAPCVLLRNMWWRPRRVFLESLPFATDWCASLLDDPTLARRPRIEEGLIRLGVRSKPESSDWLEMLDEKRVCAAGRPLTEMELAQVRAALLQLRTEDTEWFHKKTLCVPTTDAQLLLAQEMLLPDDPRLKRLSPLFPLPLVEETEVSLAIARYAGARSFRQVLKDELADEPHTCQDDHLLRWAEVATKKVQSVPFYSALRRLAWHEAVERGDEDPMVHAQDERLSLAQDLTIRVAACLRISSLFRDTGEVIFEQQAGSFWDEVSKILWLSQGRMRRMGDELVRTLASTCGLSDTLRLSRLLEVNPEEMAGLLDEDDITVIPSGGQGSLPPAWIEPDHLVDSQNVTEPDPDARLAEHDRETQETAKFIVDKGSEGTAGSGRGGEFSNGLPSLVREDRPLYGSGGGTIPRASQEAWARGAPPSSRSSPTSLPLEAPTAPGVGSSQPWSPDAMRPDEGRVRRLRSYVHREVSSNDRTDSEGLDREQAIGLAAVQQTIDWERAHGRTSMEAPEDQHGYDLQSSEPEQTRFIKVEGIDGPWTARGVGLAGPVLRMALKMGPSWWLYVVEHASDPKRAVVHALCNPFLEATEYRFDSGWRDAAVAERMEHRDPVEGETITLEDGRQATVLEAEQRGQLWKVSLVYSDGQQQVRVWQPTWRKN